MRKQQKRILQRLPEERKSLGDTIFNKAEEKRLMAETMLPTLKEVLKDEGKEVAERLGSEYTLSAGANRFLQERSNNLAGQITNTTFDSIKQEVQEGFEQGESYDEIGNRISNRYDQINKGRANTIARTEAHAAAQQGNMDGYKQTNVRTKIWVAVMDAQTRPNHASVDGEEVRMGRTFANGLRYPGDPQGLAKQIVNCRCTI